MNTENLLLPFFTNKNYEIYNHFYTVHFIYHKNLQDFKKKEKKMDETYRNTYCGAYFGKYWLWDANGFLEA